MKKTGEDFKKAAAERNITRWYIHDCSMCGYMCGYVIVGEQVAYDAGCYCTLLTNGYNDASWDDVAEHYNMNAGADDVQERMEKYPRFKDAVRDTNQFWGFDN